MNIYKKRPCRITARSSYWCGRRDSNPQAIIYKCGRRNGIRTHTEKFLRLIPLPIGIVSHKLFTSFQSLSIYTLYPILHPLSNSFLKIFEKFSTNMGNMITSPILSILFVCAMVLVPTLKIFGTDDRSCTCKPCGGGFLDRCVCCSTTSA